MLGGCEIDSKPVRYSIGMQHSLKLYRTQSTAARVYPAPRTLFRRAMSATSARSDPFRPAKRVAGQKQDVWYAVSMYPK